MSEPRYDLHTPGLTQNALDKPCGCGEGYRCLIHRPPAEPPTVAAPSEERAPGGQGCTIPPKGWYCSRKPGHEGPCAARPDGPWKCPECGREYASATAGCWLWCHPWSDETGAVAPPAGERERLVEDALIGIRMMAGAALCEHDPTSREAQLREIAVFAALRSAARLRSLPSEGELREKIARELFAIREERNEAWAQMNGEEFTRNEWVAECMDEEWGRDADRILALLSPTVEPKENETP